jgi:glycosyltransferase involved in cell wall biosynthesis
MRLAFVLWQGQLGGAENFTANLAASMRARGIEAVLSFVADPNPLARRLSGLGVPYGSLKLSRGRDVLRYPRKFASAISGAGPDGALLVERGFLSTALRAGGYRGPIIAVEHGPLLVEAVEPSIRRRVLRRTCRVCGSFTADADVAVSDFMFAHLKKHWHARRAARIYNGIDPAMFPSLPEPTDDRIVIGLASRLIPGKGADCLIRACAPVARRIPLSLLIAGDGPELPRLMALARSLRLDSCTEFLRTVVEIERFWSRCNIAVVPPDTFVESFSMTTLEAMASGRAIVATRNGAIPELITDGQTGTLVDTGDVAGLSEALLCYASDARRRQTHGYAAHARATRVFNISQSADHYLKLFTYLGLLRAGGTPNRPCLPMAEPPRGVL